MAQKKKKKKNKHSYHNHMRWIFLFFIYVDVIDGGKVPVWGVSITVLTIIVKMLSVSYTL